MSTCNTCDNQQKYLTKGLCRKCYYLKNKELILSKKAIHYKNNIDFFKAKNANFYLKNKERILKDKKVYHVLTKNSKRKYVKDYYSNNRSKIIAHNLAYIMSRSKIDPLYRISRNLRSRLSSALKNNYKNGSAIADLGCSLFKFKIYLQLMFHRNPRDNVYMTWDNYGVKGWHVDHIRPLCNFDLSYPHQVKIACHYSNLRPMWAWENLKKGGRGAL